MKSSDSIPFTNEVVIENTEISSSHSSHYHSWTKMKIQILIFLSQSKQTKNLKSKNRYEIVRIHSLFDEKNE
jgi:hypothetical protein